jgi:hypothetical protein
LQRFVSQLVGAHGGDDECRVSAAVAVAVFSLRLMMRRLISANAGCACEARAFGSSSRRNNSWGQAEGMFSRKVASTSKR